MTDTLFQFYRFDDVESAARAAGLTGLKWAATRARFDDLLSIYDAHSIPFSVDVVSAHDFAAQKDVLELHAGAPVGITRNAVNTSGLTLLVGKDDYAKDLTLVDIRNIASGIAAASFHEMGCYAALGRHAENSDMYATALKAPSLSQFGRRMLHAEICAAGAITTNRTAASFRVAEIQLPNLVAMAVTAPQHNPYFSYAVDTGKVVGFTPTRLDKLRRQIAGEAEFLIQPTLEASPRTLHDMLTLPAEDVADFITSRNLAGDKYFRDISKASPALVECEMALLRETAMPLVLDKLAEIQHAALRRPAQPGADQPSTGKIFFWRRNGARPDKNELS